MSFSVGIIGLPNAGKSTLFKALTKKNVDIAAYPFTTIHPNVGIVVIPDERLKKIASVVQPEKTTETFIEFIDIAGLVKGAHKGEGLGNQFLSHIRNCDAILEVVRAFLDSNVEHVAGEIEPKKDIEIVKTELLMKDLETLESLLSKSFIKKDKKIAKKFELLKRIKAVSYTHLRAHETLRYLVCRLLLEKKNLDLITFFTVTGEKETKAWTLKRDLSAIDAAEKVHSDFKERFIRAEIIPWQKLVEAGSWTKAKELGQVKTVGKEYIVQDGDIIEFKI